jgi:SAM-dependent methyltransferase
MQTALEQLIERLARRDTPRAEAMIQADVRQLLLTADLNLNDADVVDVALEAQAGGGRRIDVEVGATVIEVKRDLRPGNVRAEAVQQLQGYVEHREKQHGTRYVGVLTDGAEWRCYNLQRGRLSEVACYTLAASKPNADEFLVWLEGVLATGHDLPPTPEQIRLRLGAGSSSHKLDRASLAALYQEHKDAPEVRTKRLLWAKLLETALGTQFEESDELFVEHTLLVNSAEIIAHVVVVDEPVTTISPLSLLSGSKFEENDIFGVVEADFFDWVVLLPGGDVFVRTLARRLARFNWSAVEHDVLKVLYESVIGPETRKKLGEYYTPDWLAEKVVEEVVTDPLQQRVLDPACGSGTFLFHAVRRYLAAADAQKMPNAAMLEEVVSHVFGMDLHPVAVTLARITYLLAIGKKRLQRKRGVIQIPVFLGDSMQWRQKNPTLFTEHELRIVADDGRNLVLAEFIFPNSVLKKASGFDTLVQRLADLAASEPRGKARRVPSPAGILRQLAIPEAAHEKISKTFRTMFDLHEEGRDHIWGYYIRNLARPEWLARTENRVDVLVGNPPWLSYRFMPDTKKPSTGNKSMQERFREMSHARRLWTGTRVAPQQDLSGLFVTRMIQLYLKMEGRFGFVMPNAVMDREQFAGFRSGNFDEPEVELRVRFATSWDLRRLRPHFFPRGSAVIFGQRSAQADAMPARAEVWTGRLPEGNPPWSAVNALIERNVAQASAVGSASPYVRRFVDGATIYPRVLFMVKKEKAGSLGQASGKAAVRSARSANEKKPWKDIREDLTGVVETEFLRPVYLGESILPYRALKPALAVIPRDTKFLLDPGGDRIDHYPGLAKWVRRADEMWTQHRSTARLSLIEQLNYHNKLEGQFPIQPQRIVYAKAGMHVAAARIDNRRAVIDHKLYWATAASVEEAHYLCAILNAAVVTQLVRPLMSYGKDERDIDKHIWKLPIPMFDEENPDHAALASLGQKAEESIAKLPLDTEKHFAASRRMIRAFLAESELGQEIERRVTALVT